MGHPFSLSKNVLNLCPIAFKFLDDVIHTNDHFSGLRCIAQDTIPGLGSKLSKGKLEASARAAGGVQIESESLCQSQTRV